MTTLADLLVALSIVAVACATAFVGGMLLVRRNYRRLIYDDGRCRECKHRDYHHANCAVGKLGL